MTVTKTFFGLPDDRSLDAYKQWVRGMCQSLGGTGDDQPGDTELAWVTDWMDFWTKFDESVELNHNLVAKECRY